LFEPTEAVFVLQELAQEKGGGGVAFTQAEAVEDALGRDEGDEVERKELKEAGGGEVSPRRLYARLRNPSRKRINIRKQGAGEEALAVAGAGLFFSLSGALYVFVVAGGAERGHFLI
jgi:hypothetical protein